MIIDKITITRLDVMKLYKALKRNEKTELIKLMRYESSSAFKSYFDNPKRHDEKLHEVYQDKIINYLGGESKAIEFFKQLGSNVEFSLHDRLNQLLIDVSNSTDMAQLEEIKNVVNSLSNLIDTKLSLLKQSSKSSSPK